MAVPSVVSRLRFRAIRRGPSQRLLGFLPMVVVALCLQIGTAAQAPPTPRPSDGQLSALWQQPQDLGHRDLFYGPWGPEHAPDPQAVYSYVRPKEHGTNPGVVVRDQRGREWHVKQPPHNHRGAEGPVEVVLSRVLSAVGYHQPPVYFLPSFTMAGGPGPPIQPGGRFRLSDKSLKARGDWSWQRNPFVGTQPYQGLLVILLLFNSSDLKNSNNTLYDVGHGYQSEEWYVVRDLGLALGESGHMMLKRGNPDLFEKDRFIVGVNHGFVHFSNRGGHQELFRDRITPGDVAWGCKLLAGLGDNQWNDAFRAGGYSPDVAARFIHKIHANIALGLRVGGGISGSTSEGR